MLQLAASEGISSVKVHRGFHEAFMAIREPLMRAVCKHLKDARVIWCIGHSLGGALAALFSIELAASMGPSVHIGLCTFGCPRVGNKYFAQLVACATSACVRVVFAEDPVARIPPRYLMLRCLS